MRTKFFTGSGDDGKSTVNGKTLEKDEQLFEALGSLDELNSWLGVCRLVADSPKVKRNTEDEMNIAAVLEDIQESIFIAQAEIAAAGLGYKNSPAIKADHTNDLEHIIEIIDSRISPIEHFVLPGGCELAARLDFGRTLARKTERRLASLNKELTVTPELLQFINRLSSALFALARFANSKSYVEEKNPKYL